MPIRSRQNLYPGVNAHLNSRLQTVPGGWSGFHSEFINALSRHLNQVLPPGYGAIAEQSLQVTQLPGAGSGPARAQPDIGVFQLAPSAAPQSTMPTAAAVPFATVAMEAEDDEAMMSVGVYELSGEGVGEFVARIEVFSPTNLRDTSFRRTYLRRRRGLVLGGATLVEVDLLHHDAPIAAHLPVYGHDEDAFPYLVLVSTRTDVEPSPHTAAFGWRVLDPLPRVIVPLADDDTVLVDFNLPYTTTLADSRVFAWLVDYAADPPAFDRYTPDDRARLRAFLDGVRQQHATE